MQSNDNLNQASNTLTTQCIYSPLLNKDIQNRGFNLKGKKGKKVMPKRIKKIFCNMTVTSEQQFQLPLRRPAPFFSQAVRSSHLTVTEMLIY